MNLLLILAYLFFIGSLFGYVLELFYRRFFSAANPERKWINPGFCVGPYIPLYGTGLCILYLLAMAGSSGSLGQTTGGKLLMFVFMAISMTAIEYAAGIFLLKYMNLRLWDYTHLKGNIQGLICPQFSLIWALLGAVYYFLVHPHILDALNWLANNLAFSFVIGYFFGVFTLDVIYSAGLVAKVRRFAKENDVIVRYEHLKAEVRHRQALAKEKVRFFFPFRSSVSMTDLLKSAQNALEERIRRYR